MSDRRNTRSSKLPLVTPLTKFDFGNRPKKIKIEDNPNTSTQSEPAFPLDQLRTSTPKPRNNSDGYQKHFENLKISPIKSEDEDAKPEAEFVYDPVTNTSSIRYKNIKFETEESGEGKRVGHSTFYLDPPINPEEGQTSQDQEEPVFEETEDQEESTSKEREEQEREEQEQEEQEREEQEREEQEREEQEREEQEREEQEREEQEREEQEREEQARKEQEREEQERQKRERDREEHERVKRETETEMTDTMPKYTRPLTKNGLQLFIQNYELWGLNKALKDEAMKLQFPLAVQNDIAQQWFLINKTKITDASKFPDFIKAFLDECPMEGECDDLGVLDILAKKQKNERASLFVQKIRYQIGEDYVKHNEADLIRGMMKQLVIPIRRYLECRGAPKTYKELITMIREYEERGGHEDEVKIKTETGVNLASSSFEMEMLKDRIEEISASIKALTPQKFPSARREDNKTQDVRRDGAGKQFQRTRDFKNIPKCFYCQKPGHVIANCRNRMRNDQPRQGNSNDQRFNGTDWHLHGVKPQYINQNYQTQGNGWRGTQ
jgi:hypothetical protein